MGAQEASYFLSLPEEQKIAYYSMILISTSLIFEYPTLHRVGTELYNFGGQLEANYITFVGLELHLIGNFSNEIIRFYGRKRNTIFFISTGSVKNQFLQ